MNWPRAPRRLGALEQASAYALLGLAARAILQAAYLVMLARWLGPSGYGLFAGSAALIMAFAPLSGWGVAPLVSRQASRGPLHASRTWRRAERRITASFLLLLPACLFLGSGVLPEGLALPALAAIAVAELLAVPTQRAAASLLLAIGRPRQSAISLLLLPGFRLAIISIGAWWSPLGTPEQVALWHLGASLLGVGATAMMVRRVLPQHPEPSPPLGKGTEFAIGSWLNSAYLEADKVILLQLQDSVLAGVYTLAFRVVAVLTLPAAALASALLPRVFAAPEPVRMVRTLRWSLIVISAYGVVAAGLTFAFSPALPWLFGDSYADAVSLLQAFALWPLGYAWHQCAAAFLSGSGRQGVRLLIEAGGNVALLGLTLWAVPRYGAWGALVGLTLSEFAMGIACVLCAAYFLRRDRAQPVVYP